MDVFQSEVKWTKRLEKYFCEMGEKSICLSYLHKKCESRFTKKATYIDLPVIVLSTVAGTLSIGSSGLFQNNEQMASVGIGVLSLFVSVLNTVNSYFAFNRRAENHKICCFQFGKLHRFLEVEMALPREQRVKAKDLLKFTKEQYERLQEIAPLVPKDIIAGFKKKYRKLNIAKPEVAQGPRSLMLFDPQGEEGTMDVGIGGLSQSRMNRLNNMMNEVVGSTERDIESGLSSLDKGISKYTGTGIDINSIKDNAVEHATGILDNAPAPLKNMFRAASFFSSASGDDGDSSSVAQSIDIHREKELQKDKDDSEQDTICNENEESEEENVHTIIDEETKEVANMIDSIKIENDDGSEGTEQIGEVDVSGQELSEEINQED